MIVIENLEIEKIAFHGYGIGYYENQPVFVPYAVPGDCVTVEVEYKKKEVFFAKILNYDKQKFPDRAKTCSFYQICGGCDWIGIDYNQQLDYKNYLVKEMFRSFQTEFRPVIPSEPNTEYRNKNYFPVQASDDKTILMGMYERKSHNIVDNLVCPLISEEYLTIFKVLKEHVEKSGMKIYNEADNSGNLKYLGIRYSPHNKEYLVFIVTKTKNMPFTNLLIRSLIATKMNIVGIVQNINPQDNNIILGKETKMIWGRDFLNYEIGKFLFKVNYQSFLQVNKYQILDLYDLVKENINQDDVVVDAYSGIGTIGIHIAEKAKKVFCIESNSFAHHDAISNAKANNISNVVFYYEQTEKYIPKILKKEQIDTIIFDPPRKGLEPSIIEALSPDLVAKIIYVSCNPATLARDLALLQDKGYKISFIQPIDMFPHTYHIECVAVLEKLRVDS